MLRLLRESALVVIDRLGDTLVLHRRVVLEVLVVLASALSSQHSLQNDCSITKDQQRLIIIRVGDFEFRDAVSIVAVLANPVTRGLIV